MRYLSRLMMFVVLSGCSVDLGEKNTADTDSDTGSEAQSATGSDAGGDTGSDAHADTASNTGSDGGIDTGSVTQADTGSNTGSDTQDVPDDDLCPKDPDKTEPGICGCGIPDIDSDGDGILDCLDTDPTYECDIVCTGGKILSDDCEPSILVPGKSLCEMKRDSCCVEDTSSCPTLCDDDEIFDRDAYIHVEEMTCGDYLADLAPADFDCVDPYPHVPDTCCKSAYQTSPPADPSPCYDLCGDDLQMVGSRLIDGFDLTCFDYASSLNEQSEECAAPSASIISQCCDTPQPISTGNTGSYCTLCGDFSGPPKSRQQHLIGPDNLTCLGLDSDMIFDLKKGEAQCTAYQEAFFATCCDENYTPPEPVPQSSVDNIAQSPCAQPDAPKDWCDGGDHPKCDLCKDGSYPKKPYTITAIAYIPGNPTCNDLYWMGLYNHLPEAMCYPIQNFMEEPCGCR